MLIWLVFFLSATIIVYTGYKLTKFTDELAEISNISRGWLGFILLASVTSLPELITTITSAILNVREQAIGNIFGSNNFNILIVGILALFFVSSKLKSDDSERTNILTGTLYISFTLFFILWLWIESKFKLSFTFIGIDLLSYFIIVFYGISIFLVSSGVKENSTDNKNISQPVPKLIIAKILILSIVVVLTGILLSWSVKNIAVTYNLGFTFAGAVLLAVVTSLPELVVTISSIHLSSPEMAHSNLLGSNIFNLTNLAIADFFYKGSIYSNSLEKSTPLIIGSIFLTALMLLDIIKPPKFFLFKRLSLTKTLIILFYFGIIYLSWIVK